MRTRGWARWLQGAAVRGCCEWHSDGKRGRATQARDGARCAGQGPRCRALRRSAQVGTVHVVRAGNVVRCVQARAPRVGSCAVCRAGRGVSARAVEGCGGRARGAAQVVRGWGQSMWAVARGHRFAQMGICMARCVAKRVFADMMLNFGVKIRSCFFWGVR